ncbi:MAG: GNAT family N-acetyltransferase [Acidobacteria bacterium]|nr:GNAT family N-acetyltransferase [Acidobacteriota bacterium]
MPPRLRPLTKREIVAYVAGSIEHYSQERVAAGETPDEALRVAQEQINRSFPEGIPADGQYIFRVLDDDELEVGVIWIGVLSMDRPNAFWVYDVEIDEFHRGRGLGRAAMALAEDEARARGATELGLNVFGHNLIAKHLYESMGYETTATRMRRILKKEGL